MKKIKIYCKSCDISYYRDKNANTGCPKCGEDSKFNRKENEMLGNDGWEVKIETIDECGKIPKKVNVYLTTLVKIKIDMLMKKYPSIEWLAYLIGDDKTNIITDLFIPKQKVTSTRVDDIECPEFNTLQCIGVMHSHHGMGNGFSGTDHEWINQNHNISLCISKDGIAGQARVKTPCGELIIRPTKVKLKMESNLDKDMFLKEVDEKIEEKTFDYTNYYVNNNGLNRITNWFNRNKPSQDDIEEKENILENNEGWKTEEDDDLSLLCMLKKDGLEDDTEESNNIIPIT